MEGCIWKNSKLYSQANKMQKTVSSNAYRHSVEKLNGQGYLCEYLVKMKMISVPGYSLSCGRAMSRFLR